MMTYFQDAEKKHRLRTLLWDFRASGVHTRTGAFASVLLRPKKYVTVFMESCTKQQIL